MQSFLVQYPFIICVSIMLLAEVTKHFLEGTVHGIWFQHGGMPSSHSAFVASLLIVVGTIDGVGSTTFAIATVLAGIVWYDAAFVRSQVGKQAKALNILRQLEEFSERVGHSVAEVIGGIIFGTLLTMWMVNLVNL
jgi:acid phosphatase family membrane protein YuiD